jgi:ferredoxin-NADP reductase
MRTQHQKNNNQKNSLIFANKSPEDTILEKELELLTEGRLFRVYSDEAPENQSCHRIDKKFLASHIDNFDQSFYVCGPPGFTDDITEYLEDLGAKPDAITLEE